MSAVATAIVGAAVIGGVVASNSASKAARAQENAANTAAGTQLQMYNQTREDQAPWRAAGGTAVGQLSAGTGAGGEFNRNFTMADFNADPGYQFRMQQGQNALESSAAARGGLLSGGTLKALDRYGQDFASNEYSNAYNRFNNDQSTRFNRLSSIAGLGQTATGQTGMAGTAAANQISGAQLGYGNAAAAGYIGQANAVNSGISSLGNFYLQQQYMNRYAPSTTAYGGGSAGNSAYISGTPYGSGANTGEYCDYALKCGVARVGLDGVSALPVYDFWYIDQDKSEPKWRGYMAQDVQTLYPEAVSTGPRGFLTVDHRKVPSSAPYPLRVPTHDEWDALKEFTWRN